MNCPIERRESEALIAFAAGELEADAAVELERHLESCAACRSFADEQMALWNALDTWKPPAISADFDQRLYRRIREETSRHWWQRLLFPLEAMPMRQVFPLAAAACLLLIASIMIQRPGNVGPAAPRAEEVRAEQVERTLDDLELLRQFGSAVRPDSAHSEM
ncbi:MAG: zf-HC2 domain-containing protein [Bryobacteraceae bacterium]